MKIFSVFVLLGSSALVLTLAPALRADETLAATQSAKVEVLEKSTLSWNDSTLPNYAQGQPELSVVRVTIPEGGALPMHEHPFATAGVLLQGELEVHTPEGKSRRIMAGEGLIELVNQPHYGANVGQGPAVILVVYAGIEGQPVTVLVDGSAAGEPL